MKKSVFRLVMFFVLTVFLCVESTPALAGVGVELGIPPEPGEPGFGDYVDWAWEEAVPVPGPAVSELTVPEPSEMGFSEYISWAWEQSQLLSGPAVCMLHSGDVGEKCTVLLRQPWGFANIPQMPMHCTVQAQSYCAQFSGSECPLEFSVEAPLNFQDYQILYGADWALDAGADWALVVFYTNPGVTTTPLTCNELGGVGLSVTGAGYQRFQNVIYPRAVELLNPLGLSLSKIVPIGGLIGVVPVSEVNSLDVEMALPTVLYEVPDGFVCP